MPAYLVPTILTSLLVLAAAITAVIALSDRLAPALRRVAVLVFGAVVALWLPALIWIAAAGGFAPDPAGGLPVLPLVAVGPVVLFAGALLLSPGLRRFADGLDNRLLIALQGLRIMGWVFVLLWAQSLIPWQFAIPAGIGDVAVGALALLALRRTARDPASIGLWARRVNAAGLGDFAVAFATGVMTMPGPLNLLAPETPNMLLGAYPLALIPAFGVPLFTIAHILSIRLTLSDGRKRPAGMAAPI